LNFGVATQIPCKMLIGYFYSRRIVYLQTIAMFSAVIYAECSNCLMYLMPTTIDIEDNCLLLCIIPMLAVATVESRLFTYFLLMRQRMKIINKIIGDYRNEVKMSASDEFIVRDKIFFISEFKQIPNIKAAAKKRRENFIKTFLKFIKNTFESSEATHCHDAEDTANSINYVEHIMIIKSIYGKLYEISDILNVAYGMQIVSIIAVQFITLTTLLYYFAMRLIRWERKLLANACIICLMLVRCDLTVN
jgi:hypothetical protein